MRLVIERDGGFDIIEDSDRIKSIEVRSDGVRVWFDPDDQLDGWEDFGREDHASSCRLAAAIAVKCGALVEALSEGPAVASNGLEDAEDDDAMGAVMAGRIRKPAIEWVDGEPPRDGRWYARVEDGRFPACIRWCSDSWRDWHGRRVVVDGRGRFMAVPVGDGG